MKSTTLAAILVLLPLLATADTPEIVSVNATQSGDTWRLDVTLLHEDTGWDHYADGWGVYAVDGTEVGYRSLAHPHVNERPFTRSLSGIHIPVGTTKVILRPHDLIHGDGPDYILLLE